MTTTTATEPTFPATTPREPLGRRDSATVNHTLLRVVGRESKASALDVAAFQSFVGGDE